MIRENGTRETVSLADARVLSLGYDRSLRARVRRRSQISQKCGILLSVSKIELE